MQRLFLLVVGVAIYLGGCTPAAVDPPALITSIAFAPTAIAQLSTPTAMQVSVERLNDGLRVYRAQYCGVCHQLSAGATTGQFGPSHDGMAWTAQRRLLDPMYTGQAATPDAYLRESILSPEAYIVDGYEVSSHHMPSFAHLSAAEIDALVYLLGHQR